eukprot:COSAG06_NODE_869_length_11861_cov_37.817463_4_plen_127_part_00
MLQLFLTEVDNLSYQYLLGERARERVDAAGHVLLTDDEAEKLSRTKALCVVATIVMILWAVENASMTGAFFLGTVAPGFFKLAEVASMKGSSREEIAVVVAKTVACQLVGGIIMGATMFATLGGVL